MSQTFFFGLDCATHTKAIAPDFNYTAELNNTEKIIQIFAFCSLNTH